MWSVRKTSLSSHLVKRVDYNSWEIFTQLSFQQKKKIARGHFHYILFCLSTSPALSFSLPSLPPPLHMHEIHICIYICTVIHVNVSMYVHLYISIWMCMSIYTFITCRLEYSMHFPQYAYFKLCTSQRQNFLQSFWDNIHYRRDLSIFCFGKSQM